MKAKFLIFFLALLLCSCANNQLTGLQKQSLETDYIEGNYETIFRSVRTVFLNDGYSLEQSEVESGFIQFTTQIPEKSPGAAAAWGILPGGGSFYVRSYGLGVFNLLFWPISVVWDIPISAARASRMKKDVKVTVILTDLQDGRTEIRTGFTGIDTDKTSEYGIMIKRLYAEVERQTMMREGRAAKYEIKADNATQSDS